MPRGSGDTPTKKERIAAEIAALRDDTGHISPSAVVERARDPASAMHDEFEWRVELAAKEAWEQRARQLIRAVRDIVVYGDRTIATPVYVSDPRTVESSYIRTVSVARNSALKGLALQAEVDRIRGAVQRALSLAIAFDLEDRFQAMLEEVIQIELALQDRVDEEVGEGVA